MLQNQHIHVLTLLGKDQERSLKEQRPVVYENATLCIGQVQD
jgi:hypothetical protein